MNKSLKHLTNFQWHIFLLGMYPILVLWSLNIDEVSPSVVVRPLIISFFVISVIYGLSYWLFFRKEPERAALFVSSLIIVFFAYGHFYTISKSIEGAGVFFFRHRTLIPFGFLVVVATFVWARRGKNIAHVTSALKTLSFILIGLVVLQIIFFQFGVEKREAVSSLSISTSSPQTAFTYRPDIYYIILDGYGRSDVMRDVMEYDNSAFISELEEIGFYVAKHSQSNYAQTALSLSSTLNYEYLDDLNAIPDDPNDTNRKNIYSLLKRNTVRHFLESIGYKTIAFATGYNWTQLTDAHYYLTPEPGAKLNEFEYLLLRTTIVRTMFDMQLLDLTQSPADLYRERTNFTFDKLKTIPSISGPKFIFAHIIIPHPPFVFGANGESVKTEFRQEGEFSPDDYIFGYRNQAIYASREILATVREIIDRSSAPPIIIIQGDHGPGILTEQDRMNILNAYYFPDHSALLYDTITPVNSFRIVLNSYFGQKLPLIDDISYYSTYKAPYQFEIIRNPYQ